jgi:hypothetical protein
MDKEVKTEIICPKYVTGQICVSLPLHYCLSEVRGVCSKLGAVLFLHYKAKPCTNAQIPFKKKTKQSEM